MTNRKLHVLSIGSKVKTFIVF